VAVTFGGGLAIAVAALGVGLAALVAFVARRIGSRAVALAWMGVLAFVALVFGALSAGYSDGAADTRWYWGEAARYVWLPAGAAILAGAALGWAAGARRP
jgi:hypothetical protein